MNTRLTLTLEMALCVALAMNCLVPDLQAASDLGGGGEPPPTIDELIVEAQLFLDEAAVTGAIDGRGWGWIADFNLTVLQYSLDEALLAYQSETMDLEGTYRWLTYAYQLCDEARWPIADLVVGPDVPELNAQLVVILKRITVLL